MAILTTLKQTAIGMVGTACILGIPLAHTASAALITHSPANSSTPPNLSPAFGTLVPGGEAGTNYIGSGVDYSFGNREGVFNDVPALAFAGVNSSNRLDLLSPIDARIVVPGTITQGLTSFLSVEAGFVRGIGNLVLQAFGRNGNLLDSVSNTAGSDTVRQILAISRGNADIAFFRVSNPLQNDTYGVTQVSVERPISVSASTAVPTPALLPGLIGLGVGILRQRQRKPQTSQE
jgi:hypothetical protein